jgi:NAD(P)-dependent dehydrogenase (short-subunit alcohol dehydrogenase family)
MHTTPKVALVTGASSGFGQATAALLAAQGFLVFGTSRAPAHNEASSFELLPRWTSVRRHPFRHAYRRSWDARGASIYS